jgi:hypothetical protein
MMENNEYINLSRDGISAVRLDIPEIITQDAQQELPIDFLIRTSNDIRLLQGILSLKYGKNMILYRGHESKEYELKSTIMRLFKDSKNLPIHIVTEVEKQALDTFKRTIFKNEWNKYKPAKTAPDLYVMSIGRHLGLPCRLIDVTASLETAIWFAVMNPTYYDKDGELVAIICDKTVITETHGSPFQVKDIVYAHEPFQCDDLNDLPLGEQRRLMQYGGFLFVDNESLLNEQSIIDEHAIILRYTIPWNYKLSLAQSLYKDVYSGIAYQNEIEKIKRVISDRFNL